MSGRRRAVRGVIPDRAFSLPREETQREVGAAHDAVIPSEA
jgi:hypothetical protein